MVDSAPGAPARGRPRDENIDRAVLQTAATILTSQGLHALTVDAVARQAHVSRPALYRRWKNARSLALDTLDYIIAKNLGAGFRPAPDLHRRPHAQIVRSVARVLARSMDLRTVSGTLAAMMPALRNDADFNRRLMDEDARTRVEVERVLAPVAEARHVPVSALTTMLIGAIAYETVYRNRSVDDELLDSIVVLLAGPDAAAA
jgi:AcrR family transcriptional regulator